MVFKFSFNPLGLNIDHGLTDAEPGLKTPR